MKYLVTGGAGFIGSHLTQHLLELGHEAIVLDDLSTGRRGNLAPMEGSGRMRLVVGSVLARDLVAECVTAVDGVFHLASAVGVQLIIDQPVRTIETIVDGTASVLAACARAGKPVLFTSTSEVYGKSSRVPFAETDDGAIGAPTLRRWSYACAKALCEFLALAHRRESSLPVVIARLFNTIGPRQTGRYGMVVPRFVRQALSGEPITVYGDGRQTRCFCHVRDVTAALVRLLATPAACGEVFNVGGDREVSINELAALVAALAGSRSEIRHVPYQEAYGEAFDDMERRVPDLAKVRALIGYQPCWSLEQAIQDVIGEVRGLACPAVGETTGCDSQETPAGPAVNPRG